MQSFYNFNIFWITLMLRAIYVATMTIPNL